MATSSERRPGLLLALALVACGGGGCACKKTSKPVPVAKGSASVRPKSPPGAGSASVSASAAPSASPAASAVDTLAERKRLEKVIARLGEAVEAKQPDRCAEQGKLVRAIFKGLPKTASEARSRAQHGLLMTASCLGDAGRCREATPYYEAFFTAQQGDLAKAGKPQASSVAVLMKAALGGHPCKR